MKKSLIWTSSGAKCGQMGVETPQTRATTGIQAIWGKMLCTHRKKCASVAPVNTRKSKF